MTFLYKKLNTFISRRVCLSKQFFLKKVPPSPNFKRPNDLSRISWEKTNRVLQCNQMPEKAFSSTDQNCFMTKTCTAAIALRLLTCGWQTMQLRLAWCGEIQMQSQFSTNCWTQTLLLRYSLWGNSIMFGICTQFG